MTMGERFKAVRKSLGLTATEMGLRIGQGGRSSWERYERGKSMPNVETLLHLAGMGVNADWLLTGRGEMLLIEAKHAEHDKPLPAFALDEALMARLVDGITAAYKDAGQGLAPMHLGQMAARMVNEIVAASDDPEDYPGALKLRLAQLRKELQSAAVDPTSSKRSA